jgi:hypothetical protein
LLAYAIAVLLDALLGNGVRLLHRLRGGEDGQR